MTKPYAKDHGKSVPKKVAAMQDGPHDEHAEVGVLGALIDDGAREIESAALLAECRRRGLEASEFYKTAHQLVYAAACALNDKGAPVEIISLASALHASGDIEAVGGMAYLNELSRRVETTGYAMRWVEIVREKARRRRLMAIATVLTERALDPSSSAEDALTDAMERLVGVQRLALGERDTVAAEIARVREKWERAKAGEAPPFRRTVSWVLPEADEVFEPLCAEEGDSLCLIGAKSGVGKSSYARQIAAEVLRSGGVVQAYLLETRVQQLIGRIAGLFSGIPYKEGLNGQRLDRWRAAVRDSMRTGEEHGHCRSGESFDAFKARAEAALWERRRAAHDEAIRWLDEIADKRLFAYGHLYDVEKICANARAIHRMTGRTDLVVVDYLQLVSLGKDKGKQGYEIIKDITRMLHQLGKELDCTVIAISAVTEDGDDIPGLESLRGSKDAGYGADRVIMLHRPAKDATGSEQSDDRAEIHVQLRQVKGRDQGFGTIWAGFVRALTKITPLGRHVPVNSGRTDSAPARGVGQRGPDKGPRAEYGSVKARKAEEAERRGAPRDTSSSWEDAS